MPTREFPVLQVGEGVKGDTNLRDKEVPDLPVDDVWESLGSPHASRVTWGGGGMPPMRLDRAYMNAGRGMVATRFELFGSDESDHRGLLLSVERRL